jgi:IS30 family transposase
MLKELTSLYPAPTYIRSDNGPEFIAHALRRWCNSSGTTTTYIEPESPWQKGFAEYFNSRFRDELLNTEFSPRWRRRSAWLIVGQRRE